MSRIEKALERARAGHAGDDEAVPAGITPSDVPPASMFTEAWSLEAEAAPKEPQPRPGVAAPPAREVATRPSRALAAPPPAPVAVHPDLLGKLVTTETVPPMVAEQYRKVAAKLHQAQVERKVKVVMVVSAVAAEGKTLTSLNLACTLAQSYKKRVLLVDTDLRRARLHEAFQVPGAPGLHEAVRDDTPVPVTPIAECLSLVTAGQSTDDPMQILSSERMREFLAAARAEYDWVILDTAPLAVLPDANLLGELVDGAVLVISAGRTDYELVDKAVKLMRKDRILGVVLNGVARSDIKTASYYSGYYSGS